MVGVTNVGKSTLINAIIQEITGDKDIITTSRFPGTTLDKIEIPLDDGGHIYDTPGLSTDIKWLIICLPNISNMSVRKGD